MSIDRCWIDASPVTVKQKWVHERANPPMPSGGRFCRLMCWLGRRLAQLHGHCQQSTFLFPHSMVACAISCPCWPCSQLSQGSCTGAWPPCRLVLDLLLPGSEGCFFLYPIPTCDPGLLILLQTLPHPKMSNFARARPVMWGPSCCCLSSFPALPFLPGFLHPFQSLLFGAERGLVVCVHPPLLPDI